MSITLGKNTIRPLRIGTVLGAASAYMVYKNDDSSSKVVAASKAAGGFTLVQMAPWIGFAGATYMATKAVANGMYSARNNLSSIVTNHRSFDKTFNNILPVATMRQASKEVIAQNQLNARYFIGQEARLMNRG